MIRCTISLIKGPKPPLFWQIPFNQSLGTSYKRSLSSTTQSSFTEKCPLPKYDTGCTFCQVDLPPDKPLNHDHELNGTAAIPWKHVLVLSHGVEDFDQMPSKINLIPGSLAHDFELIKRKMLSPMHPVTLSNASILGESVNGKRHRVRIYPDNIEVEFEPNQLERFVQEFLVPKERVEVYNPFKSNRISKERGVTSNAKPSNELFNEDFNEASKAKEATSNKPSKANEATSNEANEATSNEANEASNASSASKIHKDLVLICAHTKRDIRCGLLAPPLEAEFMQVLKKEGLSHKVEVGRISHIGGHVYAGNVIYFPHDSNRPVVWYGRVAPAHVQGIVTETIKNGTIINELLRGKSEAHAIKA